MNTINRPRNNYVDLVRLKADKIFQNRKLNMVLNDDIWGRNTLLVKSGGYLTEDLINKLLNFGIKSVNVNFVENNDENESAQDPIISQFIENQYVLIIEENLLNTAWLVRNLVDAGFSEKNIFITADYNSINRYFKIKKVNFIFVGMSLYEKCMKCVNKYSLLKGTYAYVIMENKDSARKIKSDYYSEVKFLKKPLNTRIFNNIINQALNYNLMEFYADKAWIS